MTLPDVTTGSPHAQAHNDERHLLNSLQADHIGAADVATLTKKGAGKPEGVVNAGIGVHYIDTTVTNGALEWQKNIDGGNTGWSVIQGDTGWRNVSSLLNSPPFSASGITTRIRRINKRVDLAFCLQITSALTAGTEYAIFNSAFYGFQPTQMFAEADQIIQNGYGGTSGSVLFLRNKNITVYPTGATSGGYLRGLYGFLTDDAWPTSLPGAAV